MNSISRTGQTISPSLPLNVSIPVANASVSSRLGYCNYNFSLIRLKEICTNHKSFEQISPILKSLDWLYPLRKEFVRPTRTFFCLKKQACSSLNNRAISVLCSLSYSQPFIVCSIDRLYSALQLFSCMNVVILFACKPVYVSMHLYKYIISVDLFSSVGYSLNIFRFCIYVYISLYIYCIEVGY